MTFLQSLLASTFGLAVLSAAALWLALVARTILIQ
jgi:hypothetical protein